jgi:hypothetical protein
MSADVDANGFLPTVIFLTAPAVNELAPQANLREALIRVVRDPRSGFEFSSPDSMAFRLKPEVRYSQRQLARRGLVPRPAAIAPPVAAAAAPRPLSAFAPEFVPLLPKSTNGRHNSPKNIANVNTIAHTESVNAPAFVPGVQRRGSRNSNGKQNRNGKSNLNSTNMAIAEAVEVNTTDRAIEEAVALDNQERRPGLLFQSWD